MRQPRCLPWVDAVITLHIVIGAVGKLADIAGLFPLHAEDLCRVADGCAAVGAGAQTVKCGGQAEYEDRGIAVMIAYFLRPGALPFSTFWSALKEGDDFEQGEGRRNCCDENKGIEQEAHDVADVSHLLKDDLHGQEQESRAGAGLAAEECVACGHNDHAGHDRNDGIADNNDDCVLLDALLLLKVGAVGDRCAHAEGQGEEHLTCRRS